jgi:hypothetical protein
MPTSPTSVAGFLVDSAFIDRTKTINGILLDQSVDVASLTPKALSYFNQPALYTDRRQLASRSVNWAAETLPQIVVDEQLFGDFVTVINNLSDPISTGLFKLIDKLAFSYNPNTSHAALEAELLADSDIVSVYVPGSYTIASQIVSDTVYLSTGATPTVSVPTFVRFTIGVMVGATPMTYELTLYVSADAFLVGYNESTIKSVIPPMSYEQLYSASISSTVSNVFTAAINSANIVYNATHPVVGSQMLSGVFEYSVLVTDGVGNSVSVPFNILYKGRSPTLTEVRDAIRSELLNSGVGTEGGWKSRLPGIFTIGRYYLIPFWDMSYAKANQTIYPNISDYTLVGDRVSTIMGTTGYTNVLPLTDILSSYYERLTLAASPDMSMTGQIARLSSIIPDYQSYSPSDDNFGYMAQMTRDFATTLAAILTIDATQSDPGIYAAVTENLLTFYPFVVNQYEMCVITRACYETILQSEQ